MKQTISAERTYPIANYANIKLMDVVTDIPEHLITDNTFQETLRSLQFLRLDKLFIAYKNQTDGLLSMDGLEAIELIDDYIGKTTTKLTELLNTPRGE